MKKIVIIGANSFQNPLILKAKEMGYETHVFAWQDGSIGEKTADYFYPISIIEKEKILEVCRKIKPDAVTSIASDLAMLTVVYIAKHLGLPTNSEECIEKSTNKYVMRKVFEENGVLCPKYFKVNADNYKEYISKLSFPIIIKPTDRSGSRSVTKVEGNEENYDEIILKGINSAVKDSFEDSAIIEEFFDGEEFSFEAITENGQHHMLQITKKYTTDAPHFIETGHIEPAMLSGEMTEKIKNEIFKALDALEITMGASHSEFRITKAGEIKIIEIGPRMGGDCIGSHLVMLSTGYDFVKMVIEAAAGEKIEKKAFHRSYFRKFIAV